MTVLQTVSLTASDIKVRWNEPYASESLNSRAVASQPKGTTVGFVVKSALAGGYNLSVAPDPTLGISVAHYYDSTQALTLTVVENVTHSFDLTAQANSTVYVVLRVDYAITVPTTAEVQIVNAAELVAFPDLVLLARVKVPAVLPVNLDSAINQGFRTVSGDNLLLDTQPPINLMPDPQFSTAVWTAPVAIAVAISGAVIRSSPTAMRLIAGAPASASVTSPRVRVTSSGSYRVGLWVYTPSGGNALSGAGVTLQVQWISRAYSAGIGWVETVLSTTDVDGPFLTPTNTWTNLKGKITAPSGANSARVLLTYATTSGWLYVDDVEFTARSSQATVSGAIQDLIEYDVPALPQNLILNADLALWQRRGTGTDLVVAANPHYAADRWYVWQAGLVSGEVAYTKGAGPSAQLPVCASVGRAVTTSTSPIYFAQEVDRTLWMQWVRKFSQARINVRFWAKANAPFIANDSLVVRLDIGTDADPEVPSAPFSGRAGTVYSGSAYQELSPGTLTTSWQQFGVTFSQSSSSFPITSTATEASIAFKIYCPSSIPGGPAESVSIAGIQVWASDDAIAYPAVPPFCLAGGDYAGEFAICQRYYEKSYQPAEQPGSTLVLGSSEMYGFSTATTGLLPRVRFRTSKRALPKTPAIYEPVNGQVGYVYMTADVGNEYKVASSVVFSRDIFEVAVTPGGPSVLPNATGQALNFHWVADAEFGWA